jgi:5-oxoprolinase (ATP-hydrolysing) subunit A
MFVFIVAVMQPVASVLLQPQLGCPMQRLINLNADIAEGFGAYTIGNDEGLLPLIKSANVACGFHGGDASTMQRFCVLAKQHGVSIGAHPGFHDLWGFGRRSIQMKPADLEYMVAYQIGALQGMARYSGQAVTHLKAHGALSNMASVDSSYAEAIARAVKVVDASIIFVVLPGTELEKAGVELGLTIAREGFADRQYEDDLTLSPRAIPGTVIHDPALAAAQALRMARDGEVVSRHGRVLKLAVDTICIHGDEPTAVAVGQAVNAALSAANIQLVPLPEVLRGGKTTKT